MMGAILGTSFGAFGGLVQGAAPLRPSEYPPDKFYNAQLASLQAMAQAQRFAVCGECNFSDLPVHDGLCVICAWEPHR